MSKKAGILTFHYADNYGAVLQAWALRKAVNHLPGCTAEIINYVPEHYRYLISPDHRLAEMEKQKIEKFHRFLSEHCNVNSPMLRSVTGNEYDLYIVGSDQIWNTDNREVSADYEYFFPNLDERAKRAAYSASIGMDHERIDKGLFRQYLSQFEMISLREESYTEFISELTGKECKATLDPTMLLSEAEYDSLIEKPDTTEEPYLLYFWYDMGDGGLESIETVNILARKYGLAVKHTFSPEVFLINQMLAKDGGYMFDAGIGEFLWYIKNARAVVTNSFHGMVLAILFRKPLYIYYPKMRKCRQENLVRLLHLQDRVLEGYVCPDNLNMDMDYTSVFSILEKEREKSISYLEYLVNNI